MVVMVVLLAAIDHVGRSRSRSRSRIPAHGRLVRTVRLARGRLGAVLTGSAPLARVRAQARRTSARTVRLRRTPGVATLGLLLGTDVGGLPLDFDGTRRAGRQPPFLLALAATRRLPRALSLGRALALGRGRRRDGRLLLYPHCLQLGGRGDDRTWFRIPRVFPGLGGRGRRRRGPPPRDRKPTRRPE
uniref:Uncharacterized protein n=1 Tax=Ixodes ricinus TaxID=34613 RepID=A0A6B0V2D2_IXORI